EVRVREDDRVDRRRRNRKRLPVAQTQLFQSLEQATIDQNQRAVDVQQMLGAGDRACRPEESQRCRHRPGTIRQPPKANKRRRSSGDGQTVTCVEFEARPSLPRSLNIKRLRDYLLPDKILSLRPLGDKAAGPDEVIQQWTTRSCWKTYRSRHRD